MRFLSTACKNVLSSWGMISERLQGCDSPGQEPPANPVTYLFHIDRCDTYTALSYHSSAALFVYHLICRSLRPAGARLGPTFTQLMIWSLKSKTFSLLELLSPSNCPIPPGSTPSRPANPAVPQPANPSGPIPSRCPPPFEPCVLCEA